jgi:ferrous iron transport protein A
MMPLTLAKLGEINSIKRVGGKAETRKFLSDLGFVPGTPVALVAVYNGNVIVNVKASRIAINREMANRIMV